jgi:hypothetical protein
LKKLLVTNFSSYHSGAKSPEILEILADFKPFGFVQVTFSFHFKAYSINCFQIGAAQLSQSQFCFILDQSVFQAQTTVVICGVYQIVHKSHG